jgi:putative membrane protein
MWACFAGAEGAAFGVMHHHSLISSIVQVLITGVSVLIVGKLLPGVRVKSYASAVFFAIVLAVFNVIAWTLLAPLTVTFSVLTLGIGAVIINTILFMLADVVVPGIEVSGFFTALFASLGVKFFDWALSGLLHFFLGKNAF